MSDELLMVEWNGETQGVEWFEDVLLFGSDRMSRSVVLTDGGGRRRAWVLAVGF